MLDCHCSRIWQKVFNVVGFDLDVSRVKELHKGYDRTNELNDSDLLILDKD